MFFLQPAGNAGVSPIVMNPSEQDDPVWKLLENSRSTEPSPYFTRRVMREVKLLEDHPSYGWLEGISRLFSPKIAFPVLAAAAAVVLAVTFGFQGEAELPSVDTGIVLKMNEAGFDPESEMEAVEYLGQLMAVADPAQLSDAALADLFF